MKGSFWLSLMLLLAWLVPVAFQRVTFQRDVLGHLKRAADANSVEIAAEELDGALAALERRGVTRGYTSLVYQTPDEDIGFWFRNLRVSCDQLRAMPPTADRNMALMKLRQTLLDHGPYGEHVTVPAGAALYPKNATFAALGLLAAFGWLWGVAGVKRESIESGILMGLAALGFASLFV